MRCPDCNKFVSYANDEEPEIDTEEIDGVGNYTIEVRLPKNCAECGTELKSNSFTFEGQVDRADLIAAWRTHVTEAPEPWIQKMQSTGAYPVDADPTPADYLTDYLGECYDSQTPPEDAPELEIEVNNVESYDNVQTKDRHGKPIKNPRYMRTLYGVRGDLTVTLGDATLLEESFDESAPASAFDESV